MIEDLGEIERLAGALLRKVGPSERRRLLRAIARDVQRGQSARIARQEATDGSAFAPRRQKREAKPGTYSVKFLYPKGSANPRLVLMKSWRREGPLLTGYDVEAGAIRSFFWDKVDKWLPLDQGEQNKGAGKFRRSGSIKRAAMFRKLRLGRNLRAGATDAEAWVGFSGRAADIARIHQEGLPDRPAVGAKPVRYVRRVLLGLTDAERGAIADWLFEHLVSATAS